MADPTEFGQPEARHSAPSNDSTPPDYPTVQTPENGGTPAPEHVHAWRYVRTFENFFDGDEEDIYECPCGDRERRYVPR